MIDERSRREPRIRVVLVGRSVSQAGKRAASQSGVSSRPVPKIREARDAKADQNRADAKLLRLPSAVGCVLSVLIA